MSKAGPTGQALIDRMNKLREAAKIWCPPGTYPRRAGRRQRDVDDLDRLVTHLAANERDDGYVSVYGFPRGHTSDGEVPRVDTLMLDFDVPGDIYDGDGDMGDWTKEMNDLLARVRLVAEYLSEEDKAHHWRFTLSGHKGVHMYLDFPAIHPESGDLSQFKAGLSQYTSELVTFLEDEVNVSLDPWLDVDSSDMGRLTRLPNTRHPGASSAFGSDRFCVPVTVEELRTLTTADYWAMTAEPRRVPDGIRRVESERAHEAVTRYIQYAAPSSSGTYSGSYNAERVEEYKQATEGNFDSLDDLWLFIEDKPCIKAYFDRDGDQFHYGYASHTMELFVMAKLVNLGVPYELIIEFFERMGADGYSEQETRARLNEVIARSYNEFNCEKVWADASRFCLENRCNIWRREH